MNTNSNDYAHSCMEMHTMSINTAVNPIAEASATLSAIASKANARRTKKADAEKASKASDAKKLQEVQDRAARQSKQRIAPIALHDAFKQDVLCTLESAISNGDAANASCDVFLNDIAIGFCFKSMGNTIKETRVAMPRATFLALLQSQKFGNRGGKRAEIRGIRLTDLQSFTAEDSKGRHIKLFLGILVQEFEDWCIGTYSESLKRNRVTRTNFRDVRYQNALMINEPGNSLIDLMKAEAEKGK